MALGALDFVQRQVPEIILEQPAGPNGNRLTVAVNGKRRDFSLEGVDAAWALRSELQQIVRFVQQNLPPLPPEAEGPRLLEVELAAANGMLSALDPHSVLLDAQTYGQMMGRPIGDRSGAVGLRLSLDAHDEVVVADVEPGGSAAQAGIKSGDRLVRLDGDPTRTMTLSEVIDRLQGPQGSPVELLVERQGRPGPWKQPLVRALVQSGSVAPAARLLSGARASGGGGNVGYIRLRHLGRGASVEVDEALRTFNRTGANGIILDLRGNTGGLYDEAAKVADEFVDTGTLVSMVGPGGSRRKDETATGTSQSPQLPLVVLVDHATASGAEIIVAALKELDRAVVVGQTTFGSGSVQVLFDIASPLDRSTGDKLGLKLTTAQFLAAGRVEIQGVGVVPDIRLDPMSVPKTGASSGVRLQATQRYRREIDYLRPLPSAPPAARSPYAISYVLREAGPPDDT